MKKSTWLFLIVISILLALIVYGFITEGFKF